MCSHADVTGGGASGRVSATPVAVAIPPAVELHGGATMFDSDLEDWSEYERLMHHFEANYIVSGDKRRAIPFNAVG